MNDKTPAPKNGHHDTAGEPLPMASPERERIAEDVFSEYREISPDEWVARWAHTVGTSAFGDFRYHNARLDAWIHRLHHLFLAPGEVERCRERFLSAAEIEEIEREREEPF